MHIACYAQQHNAGHEYSFFPGSCDSILYMIYPIAPANLSFPFCENDINLYDKQPGPV